MRQNNYYNNKINDKLKLNDEYNIVIHVGLHKTESTFLQKEIFPKIENAEVFGFANRTFTIKTEFSKNKINIISEEGLSGNLHTKNKTADGITIAYRLKVLFPNAKIIVIFRKKDQWLKSLYSEYIKLGGYESFDYWKTNILDSRCLNYEKYSKCLKSLFKEVLISDFKNLKNDSNQFIKDICDFIGVNVPKYENKHRNIKLDDTALLHWRKLNKFFKSPNNPSGFLPQRLNPLPTYNQLSMF
jgi:hypothetical protein